jgi:hypothetical protein
MPLAFYRKSFLGLKSALLGLVAYAGTSFCQTVWEGVNPIQSGGYLLSIAYGNNRSLDTAGVFAVAGEGGAVLTSPDDTSWVSDTSGTASNLNCIAYCDSAFSGQAGLFIAVGDAGAIATSLSGAAWTAAASGVTEDLSGVAYAQGRALEPAGLFVAVGAGGVIVTSTDAVTWTRQNSGTTADLSSVAYGSGLFVAVGDEGEILTSSDAVQWTSENSGTGNGFFSVAFGSGKLGGRFVAVGTQGVIAASFDGVIWKQEKSGTIGLLFGSTYGNGQFVVVGENGILLTSADTSWTSRVSGTAKDLYAAAYNQDAGQFMALGADGTIVVSKADTTVGVLSHAGMRGKPGSLKILSMHDRVSVIMPRGALSGRLSVGLFNAAGKRMWFGLNPARSGVLNIPAAGLAVGKYFVSITDENGNVAGSSFVLMR